MNSIKRFGTLSLIFALSAILLLLATSCGSDKSSDSANSGQLGVSSMNIKVSSPNFKDGDFIPSRFTCDGEDISPALAWSNLPPETEALALIMDDLDAQGGSWVHWVLYDLPLDPQELAEDIAPSETLPGGGSQGENSWKKFGYGGPCPPGGTHRYIFRVYALDQILGLEPGASKVELINAMEDHLLDQGQLLGLYSG